MSIGDISENIIKSESGKFELVGDVYLSDTFETIGEFTGELDGNGFTIYNLSTSFIHKNKGNIQNIRFSDCSMTVTLDSRYKGLINVNRGRIEDVIVKELDVIRNKTESSNTTIESHIGGLVGLHKSGTIHACSVSGTINTAGDNIGGICGVVRINATISESHSDGTIVGNNKIGGICGQSRGDIQECTSTCDISGVSMVGGITGEIGEYPLTECRYDGRIYAESISGGLVGTSHLRADAAIQSCSVTGEVIGEKKIGGLIGSIANKVRLHDCHFNGFLEVHKSDTAGLIYTDSIVLSANIQNCSVNATVSASSMYPFITGSKSLSQSSKSNTLKGTNLYSKIHVKEDTEIQSTIFEESNRIYCETVEHKNNSSTQYVETESELRDCSKYDEIVFQSDIEVTGSQPFFEKFRGVVKGNEYTIRGLSEPFSTKVGKDGVIKNLEFKDCVITETVQDKIKIGIICGVNNGNIQNIRITDCSINTPSFRIIGTVAGSNYNKIQNVTVIDSEVVGFMRTGGITGKSKGTITDCTVRDVVIKSEFEAGGIVGLCKQASVLSCSVINTEIQASEKLGGITGMISNGEISSGTVVESNLDGTTLLGGITGILAQSELNSCIVRGSQLNGIKNIGGVFSVIETSGIVRESFCDCTITGESQLGGFGYHVENGTVTRSYSNITIDGNVNCSGFIHELNGSTDISDCFSTGSLNCRKEIYGFSSSSINNASNCYWNFTSSIIKDNTSSSKANVSIKELKTYILL